MIKNPIAFAAFLVLVPSFAVAQSTSASFYFADSSAHAISAETIGGIGSTFDVNVYYSANAPHDTVNLFLGFDRSNSEDGGATPLDSYLGIASTPTAAVTLEDSSLLASFAPVLAGGGDPTSGTTRPFGLDIPFNAPTGTTVGAASNTYLAKISLKNLALASGTYDVVLYDAGSGYSLTTGVFNGGSVVGRGNSTLRVTVVPEPAPFALFAIAGIGLLLRKRR